MDKKKLEASILVEDAKKRFNQIMEYINTSNILIDEDDENGNDEPQGEEPGGQDMPPMGGGEGMGMPQGDAVNMPPMGNDMPQGEESGGQDMAPMEGGENGPEGFNPQEPQMGDGEEGMMPPMGENSGGEMPMDDSSMQPDDEVIDVSDITDAQEEMGAEIEDMNNSFSQSIKLIKNLEKMIKSQNEKIAGMERDIKDEIEKRNPTPIEKMNMQTANSYPFNVKPEEYWNEKESNSNYSTGADEANPQFTITRDDVNSGNWKSIADSMTDDEVDFTNNPSLMNLMRL